MTWGALFLRYAKHRGLPLSAGVRAFLAGDTRPVVPESVRRCQRPYCRGFTMALSKDDELRCMLCGREREPS